MTKLVKNSEFAPVGQRTQKTDKKGMAEIWPLVDLPAKKRL